MIPVNPELAGRGKFKEGISRDRASDNSLLPVLCSALLDTTWIGCIDSRSVRFSERVPVPTTAFNCGVASVSCAADACMLANTLNTASESLLRLNVPLIIPHSPADRIHRALDKCTGAVAVEQLLLPRFNSRTASAKVLVRGQFCAVLIACLV